MSRILIIDTNPSVRGILALPLRRAGHTVREAPNRTEACTLLRTWECDVVYAGADVRTGSDYASLLGRLGEVSAAAVVVFACSGNVADAVASVQAGAADYIEFPIAPDDLGRQVRRLAERARRRPLPEHRGHAAAPGGQDGRMVAVDAKTRHILDRIGRVADVDCTVLITGESGTGKELIARRIFEQSRRRTGPFVPINCAAIPDSLIESELFGYHKGAFTGAAADRPGLIEEADGGVLFLDEIGEMSPRFQGTLLRFLDSTEVRRVGDTAIRHVDTRIVAATNRPLADAARNGAFRHDLYYRLSVVSLHIPPLRERPDDVPALAEHFLRVASAKFRKPAREFSPETLLMLRRFDWPGNARQLQNVVESALVLSTDDVIGPEALPAVVSDADHSRGVMEEPELSELAAVIDRYGGNQTQAAAALGVSRTTLWRKLRRSHDGQLVAAPRG